MDHVQEDRAARARDDGLIIVSNDCQQIVEMIVPPHLFGICRIGQTDSSVIGSITWLIAPAISRIRGMKREPCIRSSDSIGAVPGIAEREGAAGCPAVAFHFR